MKPACAAGFKRGPSALNLKKPPGIRPWSLHGALAAVSSVHCSLSRLKLSSAYLREHAAPLIDAARHGCAAAVYVDALLGGGANVEEPKTDGSGATPLFIACQQGHVEVVSELLGAGAAVDRVNSDGYSPLYMACLEGHAEVAPVLLGAGAAVDKVDSHGRTPAWSSPRTRFFSIRDKIPGDLPTGVTRPFGCRGGGVNTRTLLLGLCRAQQNKLRLGTPKGHFHEKTGAYFMCERAIYIRRRGLHII